MARGQSRDLDAYAILADHGVHVIPVPRHYGVPSQTSSSIRARRDALADAGVSDAMSFDHTGHVTDFVRSSKRSEARRVSG
jgi:hypothetical protein